MTDVVISEIVARNAIIDQIHRYCTALDTADAAMLSSVFHGDAIFRLNPIDGGSDTVEMPASSFVDLGMPFLRACEVVFHQMGNIIARIEGDRATVQSYVIAYHRVPASLAESDVVPSHKAGVDEDWIVGDRYDDVFECRDGAWKITRREATHLWERWESTDARSFPKPSLIRRADPEP